MFLQCAFATLCFLLCLAVSLATQTLEGRIEQMYLEKYALFDRPKDALTDFCSREARSLLFDCPLRWYWHQDGAWKEVCSTPRSRWFFPPRYYRLLLQCQVRGLELKRLRSEWTLFY